MGNPHDVLTADPANDLTILAQCERLFAEVLADIVGAEHVSADSHFFEDLGADSMLMARFCARVRKRPDLPAVAMTDVYAAPTIRSLAGILVTGAPAGVQDRFAGLLCDVLGTAAVGPDQHFFDDLGADSMLMTRFCARVRKEGGLPPVAIPDVYRHPTVRGLAAAVAVAGAPAPVE